MHACLPACLHACSSGPPSPAVKGERSYHVFYQLCVVVVVVVSSSSLIWQGERNYHVFYQLCKGASDAERKAYCLAPKAPDYAYTVGLQDAEGTDDTLAWGHTTDKLATLGFDDR